MRKILINAIALLVIGLAPVIVFAGARKISGYIFDKTTGKAIPDANIVILTTPFGAASRDGGFYFIENIPPGQYEVSVNVIGYDIEIQHADIIQTDAHLNFSLRPRPIEFDPIIVTATLSDHRQSRVSVVADVFTLARLQEQTGHTVGEILQNTGSVYFNSYDGITGPQVASIRGTNADQVVVLLDGLRLNTAQGGGVDLNLIPVAALERIEIVRGGHSALTGSDAIGGAIQLISHESMTPKGFLYSINTTLGSFGLQDHNLYGSQKIGKLHYFLSYHHLQSDGDFSYKLPNSDVSQRRENNDYRGANVFFKAGLDLTTKNKVQVIVHDGRVSKGNAGSVNRNPWTNESMLTPRARSEMTRQIFSLRSENQILQWLRLEAQSYYQTYTYGYKDPAGYVPTNDRHENSVLGLNLQGQLVLNAALQLISGVELRQDRLTSTRFQVDNRNSQGVYGQVELQFPLEFFGLRAIGKVLPAVRRDHYSDVETPVVPKLGLLISTGDRTGAAVRGNIGRSFRVPTFDDLYWPEEAWVKGNSALKPETSTDYDLGIVISRRSNVFFQAELTFFNNDIENLITWGPDATGIWMPFNLGQADITGFETGFRWRLPGNNAYFNAFHTWLRAVAATPDAVSHGNRLIYRPEHKVNLQLGSHLGLMHWSLDYSFVGDRFATPDNLKKLPEHQLLNGKIGCNFRLIGIGLETQMQVLNILDKSIYMNDGYPFPGREFRFSLGVQY